MALQTQYTWATFVTAVKALIPIDAQRQNTATMLTFKLKEAVARVQHLIEFFRSGHETNYGIDDVVSDGQSSVGTLPDFCNPEDAWLIQIGEGCGQMPLRPYSWDNRDDLKCSAARVVNGQGHIAFDPKGKTFVAYPGVIEGWQLRIRWNGIKTVFADADAVPFDDNVVSAVAEWVKAYFYREVDRSPDLARDCLAYFAGKCSEMYVSALERARSSRDDDSAQVDPCGAVAVAFASTTSVDDDTTVDFVAFGDFGEDNSAEGDVADLVKSLNPKFIVFLGDLVYPDGAEVDIEDHLLKYYDQYIPDASYPVWGNHDQGDSSLVGGVYGVPIANLYPDIMALNSGKRYYTFASGPVRFFVINGGYTDLDPREPDGITQASVQGAWLGAQLALSTEDWNVVCMHRGPYTSDITHNPGSLAMRWPFKAWGADLLLTGHGHNYERLLVGSLPILQSGLGGSTPRAFVSPAVTGSQFRYNTKNGALRITATAERLQAIFYAFDGAIIDNVTYTK
jgi:tartrate-resistant acid phosphatase type 5